MAAVLAFLAAREQEAAKPRSAKWEAIRNEYRCGVFSNVIIGKLYGISETAIRKRAKKEGWRRDLAEAVRRRVQEKLFYTL